MNAYKYYQLTAAGLLLGASSLLAQDPIAQPGQSGSLLVGPKFSIGSERAARLDSDGVVRGGGAHYRAEFDRAGMTFTPALGLQAERLHPFQIAATSVHRGDTVLVKSLETSAPRLDEWTIDYDRGGITERFELRSDGVELSYVFPQRPTGNGDLVVRTTLTTDLSTTFRGATSEPIQLTAEGIGGVTIGKVTGIDAAGATTAGSLRFDGTHLDLVLPARFVDDAAYPLVLDPLIGTSFIAGSVGNDDDQADVAYESTTNEFVVVWRRTFSGTSALIRAQRIDGTTSAPIGSFLVIANTGVCSEPAIAAVATTDRFLIAWQTGPSAFGPWDVACRGLNAGTTTLSAEVPIAATTANEMSPDVGGERAADDEAMVTWAEDGVRVMATQVTLNAGGADPAVFSPVVVTTGLNVSDPSISKSGGTTGRFGIVWSEITATKAVFAQFINRNSSLIGSRLSIAIDSSISEETADIDGDGTRFVCVWSESESGLTGDQDVYCRQLSCTATTSNVVGAKTAVEADPGDDERDPSVAFLGPKFVVTWTDEAGGFLDTDVYGISLDPSNCERCGLEFWLMGTRDREEGSSIGSKWAGGSGSDDAMLVCSSYDFTTSFTSDVMAQQFSAVGPGGPVASIAPRCGGGGVCSISGAFAFANTVSVRLSGAAPSAFAAALHIGLPGPLAPCGGCSILNPIIAVPAAIAGGNASVPLNIDCSTGLAGFSFQFQYVLIGAPITPCIFAPTGGFSNVVDAQFGY